MSQIPDTNVDPSVNELSIDTEPEEAVKTRNIFLAVGIVYSFLSIGTIDLFNFFF